MVRAANGLAESAQHAAELCERRVETDHTADDVGEWQDRAKHWRLAAERAMDVVLDWEAGPPLARQQTTLRAASELNDWVLPVLTNAVQQLQSIMLKASDADQVPMQRVVDDVELTVCRLAQITAELRN
jgi:hypothetical protein